MFNLKWKIILVVLITIIIVSATIIIYQNFIKINNKEKSEETKKLYTIPEEHYEPLSFFFSPNGKYFKFAYVGRKPDGKDYIVIDGFEKKEYESVGPLTKGGGMFEISSDGKLAFTAMIKGRWFLVINDKVFGKGYDGIDSLIFSPDGKSIAYVASEAGKGFIVYNGKEGKRYGIVAKPIFSPDSKNLAYLAIDKDDYFVVLNEIEGQAYGYICSDSLTFCENGDLVYAAYRGEKSYLVINGVEIKKNVLCPSNSTFVFSPDCKNFAYVVSKNFYSENSKYFVVLNGKEGKKYDGIGYNLVFSPDSKNFIYIAYEKGKAFLVINGEVSKEKYSQIGEVVFSPNSKNISYSAFFYESNNATVVWNGKVLGRYKYPYSLKYSSDSKHLIFIDRRGENEFGGTLGNREVLIIDGKECKNEYDKIFTETIKFAEDGKLYFIARIGNELWETREDLSN